MPAAEIRTYAASVSTQLTDQLGARVPAGKLAALVQAAHHLADVLDDPGITQQGVEQAHKAWQNSLLALEQEIKVFLLRGLPDLPAVKQIADRLSLASGQGLNGELDIGPVHLGVSSATLVVQPPKLPGASPIVIGPCQPGGIAATIRPPFGTGGAGGGAIARLPSNAGFGGHLELPLGVVQVDATAVFDRLPDGSPSFLAIMGATFLPPIQLSFGFSLDRVGGIVGVNRRADADALGLAVRSGSAGDVLFAARPPASASALAGAVQRFFPPAAGHHIIGPSVKLSWLSFGPAGSLLGLDLAVVLELPSGKVILIGMARAALPALPSVLNLRLDVLGVVDPVQQQVSVDASLVDSHVLGVFSVYGDAAMRLCWGSRPYSVLTVGGFFPGYNPEPARLPALRRVGMASRVPTGPISIRGEGYFAVTSNSIQLGARIEAAISLGLRAHGFLLVDAIVQFRPFAFEARCAAGFAVSAGGFSFAGVRLDGIVSGPGPLVIRGTLTIETFLFDLSWDETFTIGSGPRDALPTPPRLLEVVGEELGKAGNLRAASADDPDVVLEPRPSQAAEGTAVLPPTGSLRFEQRRAPLDQWVERVDGRPLEKAQRVTITNAGADVPAQFSPGSFATLSDAEALTRGPFDTLHAGKILSLPDPAHSLPIPDYRTVDQIVILDKAEVGPSVSGLFLDLAELALLTDAAHQPPALSDPAPLVTAESEQWETTGGSSHTNATGAFQEARMLSGVVALPAVDRAAPVDLAGV